jgi:hypothetical protein
LESGGRGCEVGRFLTEDERRTLAHRLKQLVGNVNESPARCKASAVSFRTPLGGVRMVESYQSVGRKKVNRCCARS